MKKDKSSVIIYWKVVKLNLEFNGEKIQASDIFWSTRLTIVNGNLETSDILRQIKWFDSNQNIKNQSQTWRQVTFWGKSNYFIRIKKIGLKPGDKWRWRRRKEQTCRHTCIYIFIDPYIIHVDVLVHPANSSNQIAVFNSRI